DHYYYGIGIEKNHNKSFEWYLKSATDDDAHGQDRTALCYQLGIGTNKDEKLAYEWYLKSAEGGDMYAQKSLGDCYKHEIGVNNNHFLDFPLRLGLAFLAFRFSFNFLCLRI